MILKGMLACECLVHQAMLGVPFLGQTVLEIDVHHLVQVTLSRYHSPSEKLQSLQPTIMHIHNTNSLHVVIINKPKKMNKVSLGKVNFFQH